jgi:DNA-binding phage protein
MLPLEDIRARLARHENLRDVARQTGLAYQTVYGIRSGRLSNPRLSTMTALSRYLEAMDAV